MDNWITDLKNVDCDTSICADDFETDDEREEAQEEKIEEVLTELQDCADSSGF